MRNILLLGAGFSKNWGGPLASEVFQLLIADPEVRSNQEIHDLLWKFRWNFEDALATLQQGYVNHPENNREPLLLLQRAISRMFGRMNQMFARQRFYLLDDEGHLDRRTTPQWFLTKFDEIFTLNQDLLLEIHYFDTPANMWGVKQWDGGCLPGLVAGADQNNNKPFSNKTWGIGGNLKVPQNVQPYYKLHGSTNWSSATGDGLMIMGTSKINAIKGNDLLTAYQQKFESSIQAANTRLTVIGYGFRDEHINRIIEAAISNHSLKIFVIDPDGPDLAYKQRTNVRLDGDETPDWQKERSQFEDWYQRGLYSASIILFRRLLLDESLDREVLDDFLNGK